jgi:endoglucanase
LPYLLNVNKLLSISDASRNLSAGTDYNLNGSTITYKASYLSRYLASNASDGLVANLTLTFSSGAQLAASIVQYDTPSLGSTASTASSVPSGTDLNIPVAWKGLSKLAAAKAQQVDGTYLEDSWTQYLGPLQQGRIVSNPSVSGCD